MNNCVVRYAAFHLFTFAFHLFTLSFFLLSSFFLLVIMANKGEAAETTDNPGQVEEYYVHSAVMAKRETEQKTSVVKMIKELVNQWMDTPDLKHCNPKLGRADLEEIAKNCVGGAVENAMETVGIERNTKKRQATRDAIVAKGLSLS